MNEIELAHEIMAKAIAQAQHAGAKRITGFNLVLQDDGVTDAQSLASQFQTIAQGTMAEGARFNIEHRATERHCWSCETDFIGHGFDAVCPQCGSPGRRMTDVAEFYLDSIEIEQKISFGVASPVPPKKHHGRKRVLNKR